MNLVFNRIELNNFMSFEHAEIEFNNYSGYTLIKGINNNLDEILRIKFCDCQI